MMRVSVFGVVCSVKEWKLRNSVIEEGESRILDEEPVLDWD
jgi:hypothetical protein